MNLGALQPMIFPILVFVAMIVMIFVPQKQREKRTKQMLESLKEGLNITTIGGITGKIVHLAENDLVIETGVQKTQLKITKWAVRDILKDTN